MVGFRQVFRKEASPLEAGVGMGEIQKKEEVARVGEELREMGLCIIS